MSSQNYDSVSIKSLNSKRDMTPLYDFWNYAFLARDITRNSSGTTDIYKTNFKDTFNNIITEINS